MLTEFIQYLTEQIGQPYLWGGQHTKLTPSNYESIIHKREDGRGKYADGTTYADASIAYCRKLFNKGATELFAYDCSGLGMYFLQNLKHIYSDMTADGMMHKCSGVTTSGAPHKGWWVFRVSNSRATHIGYMISDTELIEAKGRKFGVVKSKWKKSDWSQWGIPNCFKSEIVDPEPQPQPEPPTPDPDPQPDPSKRIVVVIGKSVRVHKKPSALSRTLWIAHSGAYYKSKGSNRPNDLYYLLDIADNGWYHIKTINTEHDLTGYITNKPKLTKLVNVNE